jgi:hypothetical protein
MVVINIITMSIQVKPRGYHLLAQLAVVRDASDASDANGDSSLLSSEHTRSDTILPEGWVPDFDATSGAKYYYDNNTGEMSWEPPPGSVGGSAESGV